MIEREMKKIQSEGEGGAVVSFFHALRRCFPASTPGLAALLVLVMGSPLDAAEITKTEGVFAEPDVIRITGLIGFEDFPRFARLASTTSNAIVVLDSPGGKVGPTFDIAMLARARGFSTYVEAGAKCHSGCANIWLAGYRKFVERGGELGFHPSSSAIEGERVPGGQTTSALMGWYYAQLGLPKELVLQIFELDALTITVLEAEIIEQLGVDATVVEPGNLGAVRMELEQAMSAGNRLNLLTQIVTREFTLRADADVEIKTAQAFSALKDTAGLRETALVSPDGKPHVARFLFQDSSLMMIIHNPLDGPLGRIAMKLPVGGECKNEENTEDIAIIDVAADISANATAALKFSEEDMYLLAGKFGADGLKCLTFNALTP